MPLVKRITSAYLFSNGNLVVCDKDGQIPELQGPYSIELHKRILLEATDNCEFRGFSALPNGFVLHARSWADSFRDKNLSYEEIKQL